MQTRVVAAGLFFASLLASGAAPLCDIAVARAETAGAPATASEQATRQYLIGVTGMT
jgi:hypothetical protein